MYILNMFEGQTNALYIDSMNLYCSPYTFLDNPPNGVGILTE